MNYVDFLRASGASLRQRSVSTFKSSALGGFILVAGLATVVMISALLQPHPPFPACDDARVQAELARLYYNQKLLHAADVSDFNLVADDFTARHCAATVTWSDGSSSVVKYEFDVVGGKGPKHLSMWINLNGGMSVRNMVL